MSNNKKYKFKLRPYFGLENTSLIEFLYTDEKFNDFFLQAISEINPKIESSGYQMISIIEAEHVTKIGSSAGDFVIEIDSYGTIFISGNKECLEKINTLLVKNNYFEKCAIDLSAYISKEQKNKIQNALIDISNITDNQKENNKINNISLDRFSDSWSGDSSMSDEYWLFVDLQKGFIKWTFDMDEQWEFTPIIVSQSWNEFLERGAPNFPFPDSFGRGQEIIAQVRQKILNYLNPQTFSSGK